MPAKPGGGDSEPPALDRRLPWAHYRELFTLRNYWKTVQRNKDACAKSLLWRFLTVDAPHHRAAYARLSKIDWSSEEAGTEDQGPLHNLGLKYLEVFDGVVAELDASPTNADAAIDLLRTAGQGLRAKAPQAIPNLAAMEASFLFMVAEVLGDERYNDKAQALFTKFFRFVVQQMAQS